MHGDGQVSCCVMCPEVARGCGWEVRRLQQGGVGGTRRMCSHACVSHPQGRLVCTGSDRIQLPPAKEPLAPLKGQGSVPCCGRESRPSACS